MTQEKLIQKVQGKKILITGGCGFIGSNIAKRLESLGGIVTVFDKFVKDLGPNIKIIQGDITSGESVDKAMRGQEYVFHLSALLGVENILKIPKEVLDVNLGGTIKVLEAAVKNHITRVLYTSSSEVYGEPQKVPISEDDATAPVSTYGVSKLAAEEYCHAYFLEYGLPTTRVRYFNIYGPGQSEKFVIPIFITRIANNLPPIIYGDGNQIRSYTFLDDAVMGTILAAFSDNGVDQVFNIGHGEPLTIKDLANYIITLLHKENLQPEYKNFGDGIRLERREVIKRIPDITRAKTQLGYNPQVNWKEGIKRFVDWYLANNKPKGI